MKNFIIYVAVSLCLISTKIHAQQTFEQRVSEISAKMEKITKEEKAALKVEVEAVNLQLENGTITSKEADEKKRALAEIRAKNIENRIAEEQKKLQKLIQEKVDGKIQSDMIVSKGGTTIIIGASRDTISENQTEIIFPSMKVYQGGEEKQVRQSKQTTTQFVFAIGANNLVTDGAVANSDFKYLGSRFYEWGFTWNTRLAKNNNLLHFKYGLSLMYNDLRATENRFFVDNGVTTDLVINPVGMKDARFRNVNLVVPMHLEFDFSGETTKNGKTYLKSHQGFRFGIGGFAGVNVKSKQILKYDIDGYNSRISTRGNFNTNDFVYGLSTYIGHRSTSLYLKYDLNPLFKNNVVDQNNISLGLRFDFN